MRGPGSAVGAPMSNTPTSNSFSQPSNNSYVSTQPIPTRPNYYQSPGATSGGTSGYAASGVGAASGIGSYTQTQQFGQNRQIFGTSPPQMFDDGGSMIGPSASQIGQTQNILASKGINMGQGYGQKFQPPISVAQNPVISNFQNKMTGGSTLSIPPMAPIQEVGQTSNASS